MSAVILPATPTIEIHLADDEISQQLEIKPLRSPYSPKSPSPMAYENSDADDFRPVHLLPPPTVSPLKEHRLSKPQSASLPTDKKGIDQERFAQLLKSSRERAAMKHGRKESVELRKQVTLKVHTTKARKSCLVSVVPTIANRSTRFIVYPCPTLATLTITCQRNLLLCPWTRSGTSCTLPVQDSISTNRGSSRVSRDPSRVACHLPLHPPFTWHAFTISHVREAFE